MKYVAVKGADKILSKSTYIVQRPENLKNNWKEEFGNNNPIMIELGMGRGDMIIKMAQQNPRVNYIGLELDDNQIATAAKRLIGKNLPNLRLLSPGVSAEMNYAYAHQIPVFMYFPGTVSPFLSEISSVYQNEESFFNALERFSKQKENDFLIK